MVERRRDESARFRRSFFLLATFFLFIGKCQHTKLKRKTKIKTHNEQKKHSERNCKRGISACETKRRTLELPSDLFRARDPFQSARDCGASRAREERESYARA